MRQILILMSLISIALAGQSQIDSTVLLSEPPQNMGVTINSIQIEGEPKISPDGSVLYFSRRGSRENVGGEKDEADIWYSQLKADGSWSRANNLGHIINDAGFNQVIGLRADGNAMMLTGKYDRKNNSDIYICYHKNGQWQPPVSMPFEDFGLKLKDATYSASIDLKTLIVSIKNWADGFGLNDLYVCFWQDNHWSVPQNLGKTINTVEDEIYPVIAADNTTLYFSSKGYEGYGDFDIYFSRRLDSSWKKWTEPQNMGETVNSVGYDADFNVDRKGKYAYLSSDMETTGDFDIYRIRIPEGAKPQSLALIIGKIQNITNNEAIDFEIRYSDQESGQLLGHIDSSTTDGNYRILLPQGKKYILEISSEGFITQTSHLDISNQNSDYIEIEQNHRLFPKRVQVPQTEIASAIENQQEMETLPDNYVIEIPIINSSPIPPLKRQGLETTSNTDQAKNDNQTKIEYVSGTGNLYGKILFESGYDQLPIVATKTLDKLVQTLTNNPNLCLEITGHTDNTGSATENLELSEARALTTAAYLVDKGINPDRIVCQGFGQSKPIDSNQTEEERAKNRRVEIRIYER